MVGNKKTVLEVSGTILRLDLLRKNINNEEMFKEIIQKHFIGEIKEKYLKKLEENLEKEKFDKFNEYLQALFLEIFIYRNEEFKEFKDFKTLNQDNILKIIENFILYLKKSFL